MYSRSPTVACLGSVFDVILHVACIAPNCARCMYAYICLLNLERAASSIHNKRAAQRAGAHGAPTSAGPC